MNRTFAFAGLLTILLLAPPAFAQDNGEPPVAAQAQSLQCIASAPPCGYVTPLIDIDVPTKVKCAPTQADLSKCTPLLNDGESITFEGTVRWYWKLSEDLTYPQTDPNEPVVISFTGSASNVKYLTFKVEPEQFTIDQVAGVNPQNMKVDQSNPSSPVVYYWFEQPLSITVTRSGDPSAGELANLANRHWIQTFLVKAKSTASGAYFKESFGVESFGFDAVALMPAIQSTSSQASPAWGLMAPVAALALVAASRRRR